MYVNAALVPSLGTSTVIKPGETIRFLATIRVSNSSQYSPSEWKVELWYGYAGSEWSAASFTPSDTTVHDASVSLSGTVNRVYTLDFPTDASEIRPLSFTLRYKPTIKNSWIWIKETSKIDDGKLLFQAPLTTFHQATPFESLFDGTDQALTATAARSQVTGVDVYHVSAAAQVNDHDWTTVLLGHPTHLERFYATIRLRASWMIPRQGKAPFVVDQDALIMGYVRNDGRHVVVLGIAGFHSTTYLRSDDDGRVVVKTRNDTDKEQMHRLVVSTGNDWQRTVDAAFYTAREVARMTDFGAPEPVVEELEANPEPTWFETWYDGLGFCTWNGLGRELTEQRLLDSLQDLKDSGVFVSTVIIDDNWQSLDSKLGWQHFEANEHFPNGLRHTVQEIRRRFPHIKHVAVWHAHFGYWEGISPNGFIAKNYKTKVVKWQHGRDLRVVDASDIGRLYNDFYRFLSSCGIDAVKCDVQSAITQLDDGDDRSALGRAYQDAFKLAHLRYFSGRVIYCMAQQPAIYFHSLMANRNPKPLLRNSDDFYPDIPSSHAWHVFANAMNNVYTSHLNVIPDWDMFQSSLPQYGGLHAAARCISGGPIYITDSPKSHDIALLRHMTALSVRGPDRHVIIRPSRLALPVDPYTAYNSNKLLKCRNYNGGWRGNSLLAIFNVSEGIDNSDIITLNDFPGIDNTINYVVRSHQKGKCFPASSSGELNVAVNLPTAGWDFFSAVPVKEVTKDGKKFNVAVLGLVSNLAGAAAVEGWTATSGPKSVEVVARLKALGVLGYYISNLPSLSLESLLITIADHAVPFETVRVAETDENVVEVDVEKAFKLLGLSAGWYNEVAVKLYV